MTLRVTVLDVETGETDTAEVKAGDYILVCAEPCHLHYTQVHRAGETHVLTVKGRRP